MIRIILILSQICLIRAFPAEVISNFDEDAVKPDGKPDPDSELIQPSDVISSPSEMMAVNEKIRQIADSYRSKESKSSLPSKMDTVDAISNPRQTLYATIDHVSPSQRPPLGRPPSIPADVETFDPPTNFGSLFPNVPLPPDVEIFRPTIKPVSFMPNAADLKNAASGQQRNVDRAATENIIGSQSSSFGTLGDDRAIAAMSEFGPKNKSRQEKEATFSGRQHQSNGDVFSAFKKLSNDLENEKNGWLEPLESEKPTVMRYVGAEKGDNFLVSVYHDPPKICYIKFGREKLAKCKLFTRTENGIEYLRDLDNQNLTFTDENGKIPQFYGVEEADGLHMDKKNESKAAQLAAVVSEGAAARDSEVQKRSPLAEEKRNANETVVKTNNNKMENSIEAQNWVNEPIETHQNAANDDKAAKRPASREAQNADEINLKSERRNANAVVPETNESIILSEKLIEPARGSDEVQAKNTETIIKNSLPLANNDQYSIRQFVAPQINFVSEGPLLVDLDLVNSEDLATVYNPVIVPASMDRRVHDTVEFENAEENSSQLHFGEVYMLPQPNFEIIKPFESRNSRNEELAFLSFIPKLHQYKEYPIPEQKQDIFSVYQPPDEINYPSFVQPILF